MQCAAVNQQEATGTVARKRLAMLSFEIMPSLTGSCASAHSGVPNRSPATACRPGSPRPPPTSLCASGTATGVAA